MKQPSILLAQRYGAALKRHLKDGSQASMDSALRLGSRSVALGLETLDLAKIHEQTMTALLRPGFSAKLRATMTRSAGRFFVRASAPIEETHRAESATEIDLRAMKKTLGLRTEELAAANDRLRGELTQRKVIEAAFEKRAKLHNRCLEESLALQTRLRQLTHRLMAAQEDERNKISRELEDEIAQTLSAINVRLLALRQEAMHSSAGFKDKLASTQRLVAKSARSVRQVARKVGNA